MKYLLEYNLSDYELYIHLLCSSEHKTDDLNRWLIILHIKWYNIIDYRYSNVTFIYTILS